MIGAIAVLAALAYLAIQTRQARLAAEETARFAAPEATHAMLDLYFDWRRTLFSNPEHREIAAKANTGQALAETERFAPSVLFRDLFAGLPIPTSTQNLEAQFTTLVQM